MDWIYLSKLIPLFLYPLNLFFLLVMIGALMRFWRMKKLGNLCIGFGMIVLVVSSVPQTALYLIKKIGRAHV